METQEELKKKVEIAKHAVEGLDPALKEVAFKTLLDKLLSNTPSQKSTAKTSKRRAASKGEKVQAQGKDDEGVTELLNKIDRTKYPKIYKLKSSLNRSLYLLKILSEEYGKDGLSPLGISRILTEKFRLRTTPNAVSMALMNAKEHVDRKTITVRGAQAYKYLLMHGGEKHIEKKLEEITDEDH